MYKGMYYDEVKEEIRTRIEGLIEDYGEDDAIVYIEKERDAVTGNDCGSFTMNRIEAQDNVLNNKVLLSNAFDYFDLDYAVIGEMFICDEWEQMDVIIREYIFELYHGEIVHDIYEEND